MTSPLESLRKKIVEYIQYEINTFSHSPDCLESLDVAKQCLETVWNIENAVPSSDLLTMYEFATPTECVNKVNNIEENYQVDEDDRRAAESLKTQGNICMGENLFSDAVSCYTKAIELDPRNAVYYCNRAAAFSKLNKNESAIEDCEHALKIDSKYGKAYSRMGLAYTAMGKFEDAINCYKLAIEIEPDNQNYKQNLQAAEERKSTGSTAPTGSSNPTMPNFGNIFQNFDISSFLSNPAMMNMAQEVMSRPEMRNVMSQMMNTMMTPGTQNTGSNESSENNTGSGVGDTNSMNNFLAFGQQMAQQMQSANPELVDSLRNQFRESTNHENSPESK